MTNQSCNRSHSARASRARFAAYTIDRLTLELQLKETRKAITTAAQSRRLGAPLLAKSNRSPSPVTDAYGRSVLPRSLDGWRGSTGFLIPKVRKLEFHAHDDAQATKSEE